MNAETFLKNFGHIADAPKGVARLRTFALELAFNGRFSCSRRSASSWSHQRVDELATEMSPGFACSKKNEDPEGYVHLRTHNVGRDGRLNQDLIIKVALDMIDQRRAHLRAGDVLFNNTNSQELVGKTCLVEKDYAFAYSNHLTRLRFRDDVEPSFVVYYFNLLLRTEVFARMCNRWIGQAGINTKALAAIEVPLPARSEQQEIVATIDRILRLCDELEDRQQQRRQVCVRLNVAALDRLATAANPADFQTAWHRICEKFSLLYSTPETLTALRQTILQLAVQGKLVSQDSNEEPASVLLDEARRVKHERANKDTADQKDDSIASLGVEFPASWRWARIEDLFDVSGGIQKQPKRTPVRNHFPYLRVGNVYRGRLDLSEVKRFELFGAELERWRLQPGDLLIVEGNGSEEEIGRCAIWRGEIADCVHQNHIIRCRPLGLISSVFTQRFLNSPIGVEEMKRLAISTSGLHSLSVKKVRGIAIPVPPLAEQERIVARLDSLLALCVDLEERLARQRTDAKQLLDAFVRLTLDAATARPHVPPVSEPANKPRLGVLGDDSSTLDRAAIAARIIDRLHASPNFGSTQLEKAFYFGQTHVGVDLGVAFKRMKAGPFWDGMYPLRGMAKKKGWFSWSKGQSDGERDRYAPGPNIAPLLDHSRTLLRDRDAEFTRLLDLFSTIDTTDAELFATAHAVWNDFLLEGRQPSDDEIIHDLRNNWHSEKKKFTPQRIRAALEWLRSNRLVPNGRGCRTLIDDRN